MSFKPCCPKCGSYQISLIRNNFRWGVRSTGEEVFHCGKCGKMLLGDAAVAEVRRQVDEMGKAGSPQLAAPPVVRPLVKLCAPIPPATPQRRPEKSKKPEKPKKPRTVPTVPSFPPPGRPHFRLLGNERVLTLTGVAIRAKILQTPVVESF